MLPPWFQWALRTVVCALVAFALLGMPLAMAGWFRPLPVALLTIAGAVVLLRWAPAGVDSQGSPSAEARWVALGALALAAAFAAFNAHFSSEHVLADRDPGIYLWHGRWIASTGRLLVDSVQPLFGPLVGRLPDHCPSACTGAPGGRLYIQFLHLFPLTLAAADWIGGPSLMVKLNALLGGFSLLAFFAFATRLVRPTLALAAAAALAVNLVEVHFARDSVSEVLAQALLFGGLYLLWEARRRWDARGAAVAGLAIGATCMVRIDSFVYLIPLLAYLFGEVAVDPRRRRFAVAAGAGLAVPAALGFADLYFFSRPYYHFEMPQLRPVGIALGVALLAGPLALLAFRRAGALRDLLVRARRPAAVFAPLAIVALALFAAFVRPSVEHATLPANIKDEAIIASKQRAQGLAVEPSRSYGEHSFLWLDWYLGPVALAAGVAGLALMVRRLLLGRAGAATPFLGVLLTATLLYLWRPSIFPDQIWAMRRFLPVVIPGLLLLAAWLAGRLIAKGRRLAIAGGLAVVAGMIAVPLVQLVPLHDERQQAGALAAMRTLCRSLPPRAAVIAVKSPNVIQLVQPVHAFCGVPVGQASPFVPPRSFVRWAPLLRRSGHSLALIATDGGSLRTLLGRRAPRRPLVTLRYRLLEQRLARRPKRQLPESVQIWLARG